jgi:hypothetical protein
MVVCEKTAWLYATESMTIVLRIDGVTHFILLLFGYTSQFLFPPPTPAFCFKGFAPGMKGLAL